MTQTPPPLLFPLLSLSLPSFPPLPEGLGAEPPMAGVRDTLEKIEIEFGAFWRIFVSKLQLNINIQIRAKRTYKLRMSDQYIYGGILPPSGCNSLPRAQFGRMLSPLPTPVSTCSEFGAENI